MKATTTSGQDRGHADRTDQTDRPERGAASRLLTAIKIGALVFALVLGAVAVAAWISEEPETLSFDYEGFD